MYNRYIRGDGGTYTRISAEDAPLPPPEVTVPVVSKSVSVVSA